MAIVGRLTSTGILRATTFDELSGTSSNIGVTSTGTFYASELIEGDASLASSTPMRFTNDKKLLVYDSFDELTGFGDSVFGNLLSLSSSLNALTSISASNLGTVQSTIQAANSSFNVFAVATHNANAESLSGTAAAGGKATLAAGRFVYNSSASNILSTGNNIVDMSGGGNNSLSIIDGKKWMAMAVYDGTTNGFRGILLWIFTGDSINNVNAVTTGGRTITTTKSIFQPALASPNFARIYQVVIGTSGNILASNTSGNAGWNYSDGQNPGATTGYNGTTRFSADDGFWAFILGGKVNGNAGPSYQTTNGYGLGNNNSTDPSSVLYWGSSVTGTNYVGFVFTGDA